MFVSNCRRNTADEMLGPEDDAEDWDGDDPKGNKEKSTVHRFCLESICICWTLTLSSEMSLDAAATEVSTSRVESEMVKQRGREDEAHSSERADRKEKGKGSGTNEERTRSVCLRGPSNAYFHSNAFALTLSRQMRVSTCGAEKSKAYRDWTETCVRPLRSMDVREGQADSITAKPEPSTTHQRVHLLIQATQQRMAAMTDFECHDPKAPCAQRRSPLRGVGPALHCHSP